MTFGDLFKALETEIFDKDSTDPFIRKCKEREEGLKNYMDICGIIVQQHIEKPDLQGRIAFWKREKIKKNIMTLAKYTEELYHELNEDKIKKHIGNISNSFFPRSVFDPDITLIMLHSYYGTIVTDIYWIRDLNFNDAFKLSAGKLELKTLGDNLPDRVNQIKTFIKKNRKKFKEYEEYFKIIDEAIKCYEAGFKKALNLLAITSIEALVRKFEEFLIQKQNLEVDLSSDKFNSIDTFLRNIPWKDDLKCTIGSLAFITGTTDRYQENEDSETVDENSIIKTKKINFKTRLDFLRRRLKENRDIIVHGQEIEYDKDWQSYINLSALYEVLITMKEYKKIYKEKKPAANK